MKKLISLLICIIMCMISFVGCENTNEKKEGLTNEGTNEWNCSVICADSSNTTITYCNEFVESTTGELLFENDNNFAITVYAIMQDNDASNLSEEDDLTMVIEPGETYLWENAHRDAEYKIGVRANVEEGDQISLWVKES